MRLVLLAASFLYLITGIAFTQNFSINNYNHESLYFHKYSIKGGQQISEKAVFIRNRIMQRNEVLFCMIDFNKKDMIILTEKDFDDIKLLKRFEKNGYNVKKLAVYPFNSQDFLDYYVRADHMGPGFVTPEEPRMLNTGNPLKDNKNYVKAKEAWINKYPELYYKE